MPGLVPQSPGQVSMDESIVPAKSMGSVSKDKDTCSNTSNNNSNNNNSNNNTSSTANSSESPPTPTTDGDTTATTSTITAPASTAPASTTNGVHHEDLPNGGPTYFPAETDDAEEEVKANGASPPPPPPPPAQHPPHCAVSPHQRAPSPPSSSSSSSHPLGGGDAPGYFLGTTISGGAGGVGGVGMLGCIPASPGCGSPDTEGGGGPQGGQHVVHVHVNPGETFSVRLGDQIQHIQGPATVRMVSSNGPPVPMPMQVPPGHMVQQIVDEHGILTHVILSPQPPPAAPITGGPASGSQYFSSYGGSHPYPQHHNGRPQYHHHHHHSVSPHVHPPTHQGHPLQSPGNTSTCSSHGGQPPAEYGASPPLNSTDDRTLRTRNRVRKKLQQRRVNTNDNYYLSTPPRPPGGRRSRVSSGGGGDVVLHPPENGQLDGEEETSLLARCLSAMPAPRVTEVEARSALIQLAPPDLEASELDMDPADLKYELLLSDKGRDAKYKAVFCGDATEITLQDLKPATDYHLKVCAVLGEELKGDLTEPVGFLTGQCPPDTPQPPKFMGKTKTSLSLKWNAASENGSKIVSYILEYDKGLGEAHFCEVYNGLQRQFRVTRLEASNRYMFRLAAVNALGCSGYSEAVSFFTSGSSPTQPDPPMLSERFVYALTISWIRRLNDEDFLLQMEDELTGHGFMPVYNGPNLSYTVRNLKRNSDYKFRLCAINEEGQSKWTEVVCFRTKPERPQAPSKPQIKGKMNPFSFRIVWDSPSDTGGTEITKYIVELDDGQGYDTVYQGSEREHMFDQLTPGHTYGIRVACCSEGGRSEFSECCLATTLPVPPGQCQVPKLQGKPKATSLHLRWGYPDYDGGAQVTMFSAQMISPDNSTREVYKGHDRDCIVAGLLPGRPYLFQVRAFNRAGAGPWSEPLEVVSGAGPPDSPRPPQVVGKSSHGALISWEEPFNNGAVITDYRLDWQQRSDTADFTQLYVGPSMSHEVKGLAPATMYTFRVQAVNSAGPGPWSCGSPHLTPPSSPGPIVALKAQAGTSSVTLTWREPQAHGSAILSYNVDLSDRPALVSVEPSTQCLVEDLQPETLYKIRLQAVNGIGVGPFSSVLKVTTKALPPAPPRLDCVTLAPSSIKLKWGEGRNSDLLTYTLEMEKEDGSFQPVYTGPAHTHKVTRLTELTSYEFRIFASNEAGSGPYSDTYSFTTTKSPPPTLKAPRVQQVWSHGCRLEWSSVKPMGADSVAYVLQLLAVNGKDAEYKQVYKGPNCQFQLEGLASQSEYQARVAAVRLSSCGEVLGGFSPSVLFAPAAPPPTQTASLSSPGSPEPRPWTDQQWAAVILLGFVLLAIVSAFLCQKLIGYMSAYPAAASPSSSAPPGTPGAGGGGGG